MCKLQQQFGHNQYHVSLIPTAVITDIFLNYLKGRCHCSQGWSPSFLLGRPSLIPRQSVCSLCGPASAVGKATGYGLGGRGIESRWEARFSAPVHIDPGVHPASCTMGTGSFPGLKIVRGVTLTPQPLLVPWSRKGRAIPLLPPYEQYGLYRASVPVQGCTLSLLLLQ